MSDSLSAKLQEFIQTGLDLTENWEYERWDHRVYTFLSHAVSFDDAVQFSELAIGVSSWPRGLSAQVGFLEAFALKLANNEAAKPRSEADEPHSRFSKRVFVVHGHDGEAKEATARFLEKLKLDAVILNEQPNAGRTLIEKLEDYSDVGFAVVLLTPDDVGAAKDEIDKLNPRARQNVIAELGHFVGRLSRKRVCALYKEGVEIPSDYSGVAYIAMDRAGAWKTKLAQELVEAGLPIKLEEILKT